MVDPFRHVHSEQSVLADRLRCFVLLPERRPFMIHTLASLFVVPVLLGPAPLAPVASAPVEVSAAKADKVIRRLGPYATFEKADEIADANRLIGHRTKVVRDKGKWYVLILAK
jgi:hypothetical protein